MTWPEQPVIYEVDTAVWLNDISVARGRAVTLDAVTDDEWGTITPRGIDAVWFMGVWERSPAGVAIALRNPDLMGSFREALPDFTAVDVIGSPYCVRQYVADARFGGPSGLASARRALANRGVRLVLDYVPNHVAPDHPWVTEHPERFVQGTEEDRAVDPQGWEMVGSRVLAHGRDPYFPAWPDVVQLNAFSVDMRTATASTLSDIADQCDGIRCDMAMLMINRIFAKTWAQWCGPEPGDEFWPAVIQQLRRSHPETVLLAEAYWEMEWELQQQGFDFCYDKRLYDRILGLDVAGMAAHLQASVDYQSKLVRFLENHDEPRAAARLSPDVQRAGAVAIATLPGATLWHEGQFEGRAVRPPVFLGRRPTEEIDAELSSWYRQLIATLAQADVRRGAWLWLEVGGWPDNQSCRNLFAWAWDDGKQAARHLVVINFSSAQAQGQVRFPWSDTHEHVWRLRDQLRGLEFERQGSEMAERGLFVDLEPWACYVFEV
jgi:hypothetical protein